MIAVCGSAFWDRVLKIRDTVAGGTVQGVRFIDYRGQPTKAHFLASHKVP